MRPCRECVRVGSLTGAAQCTSCMSGAATTTEDGCGCVCSECLRHGRRTHAVCVYRCALATRSTDYRRKADETMKPICPICTLCGAPAYMASDGYYRHVATGPESFDDGSSFCDRYGYPINIHEGRRQAICSTLIGADGERCAKPAPCHEHQMPANYPESPDSSNPKTVFVLRTVDKNGRANGGFQWPAEGLVEAPDWDPRAECGNGLHGWLRGEGDAQVGSFDWLAAEDRLWQVVEVEEDLIVSLSGKVKYPRGMVLFTGDRLAAVTMMQAAYPGAAVIAGSVTAGYRGTATAGDYATATAGDYATATAGYRGTATAGDRGVIAISLWDPATSRRRLVVGYPGENGIEAGKAYRLNEKHEFVEVTK